MTKNLKIQLTLLVLLQLTMIGLTGPAHDETYYWLFSHNLDWGYFDHPPMVAVFIKIFSFLPDSIFSFRLSTLILQVGSLFLLLRLLPKNLWHQAILLFFAFPLLSFSGNFALPDTPLLFFSLLYLVCLKEYLQGPSSKSAFKLGIIIALLLYSKYHGILLVLFTIVANPKLFLNKYFYFVALVALLLFAPHIWWQYEHQFATLRYHFLERPSTSFDPLRLIQYLGVQVGLAGFLCGPMIWRTVIKYRPIQTFDRTVKIICIGVIGFFFISTFSKKFEANWTIFIGPMLIYLALNNGVANSRFFRPLLISSFFIVVLARLILLVPSNLVPLRRLNEFQGWQQFSAMIKTKCRAPIIANTYQMASKLSFYLQEPIHSLNYHSRKNQFDFWIPDETYYLSPTLCYITDKTEFGGEEIQTPEQKRLFLIREFSPTDILKP
jgi:hypothetical protein